MLKSQIPIRTYTPWDEEAPGFLEIDVVAHGGASAAGAFAYTLDAVDSATGWTECAARPHKSQSAVVAALRALRTRFPFPLRGIDSDNGSAFINALLAGYCDAERLTFTRCRAYHKNDQAHVVSAGVEVVEVRNVAGLSCTTSSAFIFPGRGRSWASNSVLAALVSPSPLVHLKAARLCRSKVALTVVVHARRVGRHGRVVGQPGQAIYGHTRRPLYAANGLGPVTMLIHAVYAPATAGWSVGAKRRETNRMGRG